MKICIDCMPEELHELFDEPKCKTVASNSEITAGICDAVYSAMMETMQCPKIEVCLDGKEILAKLEERKANRENNIFSHRKEICKMETKEFFNIVLDRFDKIVADTCKDISENKTVTVAGLAVMDGLTKARIELDKTISLYLDGYSYPTVSEYSANEKLGRSK